MGSEQAAFEYAMRLLIACRERGITCLFTNQLLRAEEESAFTGIGVSSLVDTIILLRLVDSEGMLRRTLLVRKVRGAAHSLHYHEFRITDRGIAVLGVDRAATAAQAGRRGSPEKRLQRTSARSRSKAR
jgi:circadian clock protein KaiC